ncbi:hypothetical protein JKP88DRAFT_324049 [Tribonema minus]|uniref:Haloacid dehalogenase-like hydrolase n=1 Tax=Tribonema minus TaxID=303371 RepID=A0A835YSP8_9STRA|nr:hypothetical protein JKP88DRAFT_324049 [Tribonema minus]
MLAHHEPLAPKLGLFVADFDDTLTRSDSTPLLPLIAATCRPSQKQHITLAWEALTDAFVTGYYGAIREHLSQPKEGARLEDLETFLVALEAVETSSIERVTESKVLAGMTPAAIAQTLEGPLQGMWGPRDAHVARCLARVLSATSCAHHIISINFSEIVVRTVLRGLLGAAAEDGGSAHAAAAADALTVHCNTLALGADGATTGEVTMDVVGGRGKLRRFRALRAESAGGGGATMYIGDSVTDLLPMLSADIGIVLGNSGTFKEVAAAFGIDIVPLGRVLDGAAPVQIAPAGDDGVGSGTSPLGRTVYHAESWLEIEHLLFGKVEYD